MRRVRHYLALYRMARLTNSPIGALRELLRPTPF